MNEITLTIDSSDHAFALKQTNFLMKEISGKPEIDSVRQKRLPLNKNHAGGLLETILTVSLSSTAVVTLIETIHVWLKNRAKVIKAERKEIRIVIRTKGGDEITISSSNIDEPEKIAELILKTL